MTSNKFTIRPWHAVFLGATIALLLSMASLPSGAHHCKGPHANDPGCDSGGGGGGEPPAGFNPELVWVTYSSKDGQHIVVANKDGSNPNRIFTNSGTGPRLHSVSWSPGGMEILFPITEGLQGPGIYRLPVFDGVADETHPKGQFSVGTPTLVNALPPAVWFSRAYWSPVPAPDGNYWIAYIARVSETENCDEVFLINPTSGLTIQPDIGLKCAGYLTWSPDGKRIAVYSGLGFEGDLEVFSLEFNGQDLVVSDPVSLFQDNGYIQPGTAAEILANGFIFIMDWANTKNEIVVGYDSTLWIVPVPDEEPSILQSTVASETVVVIDDDEVSRELATWSSDDRALLYRRTGSGGTCDVPALIKKGKQKITRNLVIGTLDNGSPNDDPNKIECDPNVEPNDETILNVDALWPEWWRGTFPQPPLPLPTP